jgi:hypothetical protein
MFTMADLIVVEGEGRFAPKPGFPGDVGLARQEHRLEAVQVLLEAIPSAMRLDDANLIQEGCVVAWNIMLPLLQAEYRPKVSRLLRITALALEQIDSTLFHLRVQLHLEIAKIDIDEDFLAKSALELGKARGLKYSAPKDTLPEHLRTQFAQDGEAMELFRRPLDRYIDPMAKKINLFQVCESICV